MEYNSNNIDQSLLSAYQDSVYETFNPALQIKIGEENEELSVFLFDNNVYTWAFVSASNPFSIKISTEENEKRHQSLINLVNNSELRCIEGEGKSEDSSWSEKSLLILDISKKDAIKLAQTFEQNALVFGYFNRAPELVLCK